MDRLVSTAPLSSAPTEDIRLRERSDTNSLHYTAILLFSSSMIEDYQNQIGQLQQNLSEKDNEQSSLSERLNKLELELKKTIDDHASAMTEYESLVKEQTLQLEER
jgi:predicted transcriptional regulator